MLSVRNFSVTFNSGHKALDDLNLDLESGQFLGILGESGSGKTLLMHSALGLLPKGIARIAGQCFLNGQNLGEMSAQKLKAYRAKHVGMVFQDPFHALDPLYRIEQSFKELSAVHGLAKSQVEQKQQALSLLEQVQLNDPQRVLQSYPHELSGGMLQRVNIALALLSSPKLLVADEPTTALDVLVQKQILDLLSTLHRERGMAVILISHDIALLSQVCTDLLVMRKAKSVEYGNARQVIEQPQDPYTQGLIDAVIDMNRTPR